MKHIKLFENYNHYQETSWSKPIDGEEVKITIQDVENYLDENNVNEISVDVNEIADLCIHKDREDEETKIRSQKSDLNFPLLITEYRNEFVRILDGHHRLKKAIDNNIETIKVRVLKLDNAPYEYQEMFKY